MSAQESGVTTPTQDLGPQEVPAALQGGGDKVFAVMSPEESRARLIAIRERRRVLAEEMEQLQEEEARIISQMRRSSSLGSRRNSVDPLTSPLLSPNKTDGGEEDLTRDLSPEELPILEHLKKLLSLATEDQSSCKEAQKSLDAIFAAEGADVAAVPPQEGFEENAPGSMSATDALNLASASGANTPQLRSKQREFLLKLVNKNAVSLLTDQYGNYFIQRAFSRCNEDELQVILDTIGVAIPEVSCNMHGTRAVQRLIDCCSRDSHFEDFCESIANEVVPMVCDLNANHVIHRLLMNSQFNETEKENIFHIIMVNCVEIGMNKQGCCMIQRCLETAPGNFRSQMINSLIQNTLQLVQDPFGNYVIQFLLDLPQDQVQQASTTSLANRVIRQVLHHIGTLSCNKFSSNVIEKCLRAATPEVRQLLLDELTDAATLPKLLTQSYANYVVQTALVISDETQFLQLKEAINPLHHLLKNSPYGIKIEAKISKRNRELSKKTKSGGNQGQQGGERSERNNGNNNAGGRRRNNNNGGGGGPRGNGGQQQNGQFSNQQQGGQYNNSGNGNGQFQQSGSQQPQQFQQQQPQNNNNNIQQQQAMYPQQQEQLMNMYAANQQLLQQNINQQQFQQPQQQNFQQGGGGQQFFQQQQPQNNNPQQQFQQQSQQWQQQQQQAGNQQQVFDTQQYYQQQAQYQQQQQQQGSFSHAPYQQ